MATLFGGAKDILPETAPLVIEGGTLIDGQGGPLLENAAIVIRGNRIASVGKIGQISYPPSARVIKQAGKFILPGLIDISVHFQGWDPQMFLHYGVTSAYDTLSPTDWIVAQREMLRHGKVNGPRLYVTGTGIGGPRELGRLNGTAEQNGTIVHVTNADEARAAVKAHASAGVDIIHVEESLTPALLKVVVDEAR